MKLEVCAYDVSSWDVNYLNYLFGKVSRAQSLVLTSVAQLADDLEELATAKKVWGLHIVDHGNAFAAEFGDDPAIHWNMNRGAHKEEFKRIGKCIEPHGFMALHNCLVGKNEKLCKLLARYTGVDVYASPLYGLPLYTRSNLRGSDAFRHPLQATHDLFFRYNEFIRFCPSGRVKRGVAVPSQSGFAKPKGPRAPHEGGFLREPKI